MKYTLIVIALISGILWQNAAAQESDANHPISKAIRKNGTALVKDKKINAVSIGVYKEGEVFTEHFGEIEKGRGNTPDDETIYEIASVSKTMTGFLVAKAVLEGKIKLEDDIRQYLKGAYPNLQFNGRPITIQHLLTHTGGLPMFLPPAMNGVFEKLNEQVPYEYDALEKSYSKELFFKDLQQVSLAVEPGTTYAYSNTGAELVGHILETSYQKSLDELWQESFLKEYKMLNTGIELNEHQKQKLIRGYWMDNATFSPNQLNPLWAAGSGVKTTLADLMQYIKLQLDGQNPIVAKSHTVLYEEGATLKMAYFWRVWQDKYGTSYNHHGGTSGVQNWLYIFPKYKLGISIITNQSGPKTPNKLSKTVRKILKDLGLQ